MDFKILLEELLLELSADEIYNKFYKDIDYGVFYEISMADPKTKEQNGKIVFLGKYAKMLLDLYKKKLIHTEDLPSAKEYLNHVYEHNIAVNTNKIKGIPDLYELVKKYVVIKTPTLSEVLKALDKSEYKVLFNGENWMILEPLTEKASCYLGVQSVWCTTWGPHSLNKEYKDRSNQFENYKKQDTLYIIINKTNNEEKYQFNFVAKQFMNIYNRQIDVPGFFKSNPEIRNFFFPSFVRDVSDQEMILQRKRMYKLSNEDKKNLLDIFITKYGFKNEIIISIINKDEETLKKYITDEYVKDITITDDHIEVDFSKITSDLSNVKDTLSLYRHERDNPYESLSDDIYNRYDWETDEDIKNEFEEIFQTYYKKHQQKIIEQTGYRDYENFKKRYFEDFYENQKIRDQYVDNIIDNAVESYSAEAQRMANDISDFVDFEYFYSGEIVKLVIGQFIDFLSQNPIDKIDDFEEIIMNYLESNGAAFEFQGIYDYDYITPKYDDDIKNQTFVDKIDDHFNNIFGDEDTPQQCVDARKKLEEIITKVFKGSREFENDEVKIQINSPYVDCTDYTVDITYKNKNTGKISRGKVKVDNITKYMTNYSLFENLMSFKKLLK